MKHSARDYEVRIWYSEPDAGYIAIPVEMPNISAAGDTREEAVRELQKALELVLETYAQDGVEPPAPRKASAASAVSPS